MRTERASLDAAMTTGGPLRIAGALAVAALACWVSYSQFDEAFGAGPPYYSRTTNMDKWENPVPLIATINVFALAAVLALFRRGGAMCEDGHLSRDLGVFRTPPAALMRTVLSAGRSLVLRLGVNRSLGCPRYPS